MKKTAIILAGGKGARMNAGINKVLIPLGGKTILQRSMEAFAGLADEMIIVCRAEEEETVRALSAHLSGCSFRFARGGSTRQESVKNGLDSTCFDPEDLILVHDAARCFVDTAVAERVIQGSMAYGACIPGIPATSTYKRCDEDGFVKETPDRKMLYEIQTPQGFKAGILLPVYQKAFADGVTGTDDASLAEYCGVPVKITEGSRTNIKITTPEDLQYAKAMIKGAETQMRIGMGYDVHRLVRDRKLILCGVEIPHEYGLLGHSDADVALHALMDAMLGACALGDIGKHFPDSSEAYRGISSMILLSKTYGIITEAGYRISNADITIAAQRPKILPYIPEMIRNVANALHLAEERISIKATTTEKLGFEGREEGISAYAVCCVTEND